MSKLPEEIEFHLRRLVGEIDELAVLFLNAEGSFMQDDIENFLNSANRLGDASFHLNSILEMYGLEREERMTLQEMLGRIKRD